MCLDLITVSGRRIKLSDTKWKSANTATKQKFTRTIIESGVQKTSVSESRDMRKKKKGGKTSRAGRNQARMVAFLAMKEREAKEQLDYQQEDFGENDEENQSNPTEAQAVPASAAGVSESAGDQQNFVCQQCEKVCRTAAGLKSHTRALHREIVRDESHSYSVQ